MIKRAEIYRRLTCVSLGWRIIVFLLALVALWSPFALCFYGVGYLSGQTDWTNALALAALYSCFIVHAWWWGRYGYGWSMPLRAYGLVFCWRYLYELVLAVLAGFSLVCLLFGIEVVLGWASIYPKPLLMIALEGLVVGLGFGFAEELLFRGWLLTELQLTLSRPKAILWSSIVFAIAHFIKPLPEILKTSPQFLGLLLLGLILGSSRYFYCRQHPRHKVLSSKGSFSSLSLPMGFHGGLIWGYYIVDVADLVLPSGRVPEWVTGIGGNPLSGALGVSILSFLTVAAWAKLRSK